MTFRIGGVLVATFAISLLCTLGASAKADGAAADAKAQIASANRNPHAHAKRQFEKERAALPGPVLQSAPAKPPYRTVFWQPFGWGAPPLQNSHDAYQGYFANPLDNPRSFGAVGRSTLIFRQ